MNRKLGIACLIGFVGCVFGANWAIMHLGTPPSFPGGPHTLSLGPWTAPSGWVFVGASFSLRDFGQRNLRERWAIPAAIAAGAVLSYFVAPSLALPSALAFGVSETLDWCAFTPLADRGRYAWAIILSNTIGAAVDTVLFLWLAFDWHAVDLFGWDQFVLKSLMIAPALLLILPGRIRRRRARAIA